MLMNGIRETAEATHNYWSAAELLPYHQLKELQLRRLQEQLSYLWEKSPFYREKWAQSGFKPEDLTTLDDVRNIPFVTKEEIRQSQEDDPPYGIMRVAGQGPITRIAMTSGTTGEPVLIPFTEDSYFGVWCEGVVRSLWAGGVRKSDVVHAAFGFTPFVGLAGAYDSAEHLIGSLVVPGGAWDSKLRIRMIPKLGITVLMGTPTYLLHLARVAEEVGVDPRTLGVKKIFTTGEPGLMSVPSTGARLHEAWGAEVFEFSGTQETNYIAWLCEEKTPHLNDDLLYYEVLNPETNKPVEPGQPGKLVLTDLVQKTHPLIRYETGDIVGGIEENAPCKCGRTLSTFKGFKGRVGDIIKVRGVSVSTAGIENVIRGIGECSDNYEYVAVKDANGMDKVRVRIEPKNGNGNGHLSNDDLAKKAAEALRLAFLIHIDVEVLPPGTLPDYDFKAKRFRDLR